MDSINYEPDIIVANLMADLVIMLSPAAAAQLRPGGIYITSGILDIKEDIVKKAIEDAGFDIIEVLADGEWRAITAVRR
jgi:ribosomal protein L11 methyltransferase